MPSRKFIAAIKSINWDDNVNDFLQNSKELICLSNCNLKLAVWSKEFESIDLGNPALSFIREMQQAGHHAAILISLALYKPSAASMRTILETALYYSYFRTHLEELSTLAANINWYMSKAEICSDSE